MMKNTDIPPSLRNKYSHYYRFEDLLVLVGKDSTKELWCLKPRNTEKCINIESHCYQFCYKLKPSEFFRKRLKTYGIVYSYRNRINGKEYVGQTASRMYERIYDISPRLSKDLYVYWKSLESKGVLLFEQFYRSESFQFLFEIRVLEENVPLDKLDALEMSWIERKNTAKPNGYNTVFTEKYFKGQPDLYIADSEALELDPTTLRALVDIMSVERLASKGEAIRVAVMRWRNELMRRR